MPIKHQTKIPIEKLRSLLRYDPETGMLFWRERPSGLFKLVRDANAWNARFALKEAFTQTSKWGYKVGLISGLPYRAHRVAWTIQTGAWPKNDIDHVNGNRPDNRFCNLREATRSENNRNTSARSKSTSQFLGVCWTTERSKWLVRAKINGRVRHIGSFKSEIDAARAYDEVARKHFGDFARLNFPKTRQVT